MFQCRLCEFNALDSSGHEGLGSAAHNQELLARHLRCHSIDDLLRGVKNARDTRRTTEVTPSHSQHHLCIVCGGDFSAADEAAFTSHLLSHPVADLLARVTGQAAAPTTTPRDHCGHNTPETGTVVAGTKQVSLIRDHDHDHGRCSNSGERRKATNPPNPEPITTTSGRASWSPPVVSSTYVLSTRVHPSPLPSESEFDPSQPAPTTATATATCDRAMVSTTHHQPPRPLSADAAPHTTTTQQPPGPPPRSQVRCRHPGEPSHPPPRWGPGTAWGMTAAATGSTALETQSVAPGGTQMFKRRRQQGALFDPNLAGSRNHLCGQCPGRFNCQSKLNRHSLTHSGAKPFPCFCGKRFNQKSALKKHSQGHLRARTAITSTGGSLGAETLNGFSIRSLYPLE
jgi:hypothetical protein